MTNPTTTSLHREDQQYFLPTFQRYPLAFRRGEGVRLWDVDGNEYLDVLAGIAVNNLGHCHPKVVKAVQEQAARLIHISNFYVSEPQVRLAKRLVELSGLDRVFFTNSGAESVEVAIKIARKYAHSQGRGGGVISMENSFHGRTLAAIATGRKKYQQGFGPMPAGFFQAPFNNLDAIREKISDEVAAVILEPVQGEGGIRPADPAYLRELRALCDREGIVLIFDEIQCGIARTGKWFAKDHYGVQPDIMTLAKALGNGFPIGATLSNEKVSSATDFGDHGTTFGGNPLACSAALATIDTITEENLTAAAEEKGKWLMAELEKRKEKNDAIREVRGMGLMIGVEFDCETKPLVTEMMRRGVLANATAGNVLRLVPPLIISYDDLQELLAVFDAAVLAVEKEKQPAISNPGIKKI